MIVKNEYIDICIGEKKYHLINKILPKYLKMIAKRQINQRGDSMDLSFALHYCFFKFDKELENDEPDITDFDACISVGYDGKGIEEITNNGTIVKYNYSDDDGVSIMENFERYDSFQNFIGKKITAIGFNSISILKEFVPQNPEGAKMCAILDTSNYNIVINEGERVLIVRKDIISSDAKMITNYPDIIKAPVHLRPYGLKEIESQNLFKNINPDGKTITDKQFANAYLQSIGLGYSENKISEEISIEKTIEGAELNISPFQSKPFKLPEFLIYPGENIYPSNKLYPLTQRYSYLFFNYKIYQYQEILDMESGHAISADTVETEYEYSMVIPIVEHGGWVYPKIKYESEEK